MTLIIAIIALIYALSKAAHIQSYKGQTISSFEEENEYRTHDNAINLGDRNF